MNYTTIISAEELNRNLAKPDWIVIDCRFSLADADAGFAAYRKGHVPGARYADLNQDLSGRIRDYTGRHPLPDFALLTSKLGSWGIDNYKQVVVYDDVSGAFAGRLWWLLRCLGHDRVAVLDGGLNHWQRLGFAITTALPVVKPVIFRSYPSEGSELTAFELENSLARKNLCLIDARATERYSGKSEPIDPVAGHIPGAVNRPFQHNLNSTGLFQSPDKLSAEFGLIIGQYSPGQVVHMCGSGVTACHNLLAMEVAGLSGSRLYPGSWSEWIRNPNRSVAKGID